MATDEAKLIVKFEAETARLNKELDRTQKRLSKFEKDSKKSVSGVARDFKTILGGIALKSLTQSVSNYSDEYTNLSNRLRLATSNQEEFANAQKLVFDISQETRQSLTSTAELYQRLALSTKELNLSQNDLADITKTINQTLIISGSSAQAASAAIVQLGQGLAAGALRGQEFNSVAEQAPRLLQLLSDSLGVNIGKLRDMAKEGALTADVLVKAIRGQSDVVDNEFKKTVTTIQQAGVRVDNALTQLIGAQLDSSGAAQSLSTALSDLAKTLEDPAIANGIGNITSALISGTSALVRWTSAYANFVVKAKEAVAQAFYGPADVTDAIKELKLLQNLSANLNNPNIRQRVTNTEDRIKGLIGFSSVDELKKSLNEIQKAIEDTFNDIASGKNLKNNEQFLQKLVSLRSEIEKQLRVSIPADNRKSLLSSLPSLNEELNLPEPAQIPEKVTKSYENYINKLKEAIALNKNSTEVEKLKFEIESGNLVGINAEMQKKLELLAIELDNKNKLDEVNEAYNDYLNSLREENILTEEATELQKLKFEIQYGSLKGITDQQQKVLEGIAQQIDSTTRLNEVTKLISDTYSGEEKALIGVREKALQLQMALEEFPEKTEEILQALQRVQQEEQQILDGEWTKFAERAAENIQDAFGDTVLKTLEGDFDSIGELWSDLLKKMAAEAIAADIANALGLENFLSGGKSGKAGLVQTGLDFLGGFFAEGGSPPVGKLSVVGEKGPELFVPKVAGNIVPNHEIGGNNVTIGSMVFPGITNANEAKRASGAAAREILRAIDAGRRYS